MKSVPLFVCMNVFEELLTDLKNGNFNFFFGCIAFLISY